MSNKLKCFKCCHIWIQRTETNKPLSCPKCKRYDWDKQTKK